MTEKQIIEWAVKESSDSSYIQFPEDMFSEISPETAKKLSSRLSGTTLMKLPHYELNFFEWLKKADPNVWKDLWNTEEIPYIVGLSFLPKLVEKNGRGFPICDLRANDNYYFSTDHMVDEESKILLETSQKLFLEKKELTVTQMLVVEISIAPIDIWHFSYRHKIKLDEAKKSVEELVEDGALVHLKDAEHLAGFIDF